MTSQESFTDLNVFFVVPERFETEEQCSEDMWEAYNMCVQNEFQIQWIEEKQCRGLATQKTDVVVMEEFEGDAFEHLCISKCLRIVGPRCLLSCFLSGEPIPDGNTPIFTTAMRGYVVCVTGLLPEVKERIEKKVGYMGGIYVKELRGSVTHLIADSVMSAKYEKASKQKMPVFTYRWIDAIWEANLKDFVKADDPIFDKYKCPVFRNLVITSTSLSKKQKQEAKQLINEHGGTFMGVLDGSKVKVVLAPLNCPLTDKLRFAKQNNIACLNVEWVTNSINTGYALPFGDYLILSTKGCSTPEKSQAPMLDCSAVSAISDLRCSKNFVDESMMTTMNGSVIGDSTTTDRRSLAPYVGTLEKLDVREAKLAGAFLDGCNIYLAGFPSNHRDKVNRILNAGGATRLDDISDALTHVLIGDPSKATSELKIMESRGLNPCILSFSWLEESLRLKRPAPEENFLHHKKQDSNPKVPEPPSPLSKKNLQMLQRPKRPAVPHFDIDKEMTTEEPDESEDEASLVQQYLRKVNEESDAAERTFQELVRPKNSTPKPLNSTVVSADTSKTLNVSKSCVHEETTFRDPTNDSAVPLSQSLMGDKPLEGFTFLVSGFDEKKVPLLALEITELGGKVVSKSFVGVPDYGIVPLVGAVFKHTVDELVTEIFIDDCLEQRKIPELAYYHRPLSISREAKPLTGLVIATSTYTGAERSYLLEVAVALGAEYQDTFARKTNAARNHLGSTHLLCPVPKGSKYNAAIKWQLPAVTAEWLTACARESRRVDETPYLVGESIAPERPEISMETANMGPPSAASTRTILTPKRHFPQLQGQATPTMDTPLINKRLSLARSNTPQSPFHVATPETPYGQVFKENPSPATKKAWVQWIDSFPDMRVEEPPLKKRAPSTPFSELRRQFWQQVKEPIHPKQNNEVDEQEPALESRSKDGDNSPYTKNLNDESTKETSLISDLPINRRLSYCEEHLESKKTIELQIEQLDQVLQATSSSTENRASLSGNAKLYEQSMEPIDKCMVKDSQPETVCWEDPAHQRRFSHKPAEVIEPPIEEEPPRKLKFMLSSIKDRTSFADVIIKLGGEVSTETNFDSTATHLLCVRPARNEKMLGSIAAGKWILHHSYLLACAEAGEFIDEERYEWGNPLSKDVIPEPNSDTERSIAAAVHRWRLKLNQEPGGAFEDMVAMLLVPKEKYDQFKRLIQAGGGTVVQAKAPYDSSPGGKKVTHCLIHLNKLAQPVDWAMLASKGILCFPAQYLSDHLTAEKPINPRDAIIPEFKKYLALLPR